MTPQARIDSALEELDASLTTAAELAARGRAVFDSDPAMPLAFEALSNRIGEMAKLLISLDADRFSDSIWRSAARNRDFVVHHYNKLDREVLWNSVIEGFPELHRLVKKHRDN